MRIGNTLLHIDPETVFKQVVSMDCQQDKRFADSVA